MSNEELDLVPTDDLVKALSRRSAAMIIHMVSKNFSAYTKGTPPPGMVKGGEGSPGWYGLSVTCFGMARQLSNMIEAHMMSECLEHDEDI